MNSIIQKYYCLNSSCIKDLSNLKYKRVAAYRCSKEEFNAAADSSIYAPFNAYLSNFETKGNGLIVLPDTDILKTKTDDSIYTGKIYLEETVSITSFLHQPVIKIAAVQELSSIFEKVIRYGDFKPEFLLNKNIGVREALIERVKLINKDLSIMTELYETKKAEKEKAFGYLYDFLSDEEKLLLQVQ